MDRKGLEQLIFDTYSVEPDYPWMDTPESAVFRHAANRKWFALVTTVPRSKLGLPGQQPMGIVNLKCDPILIGSLRAEPGFYPAYHMNKENWITAALDGSAPEDKLRLVLDMSYTATSPKLRKKKASPQQNKGGRCNCCPPSFVFRVKGLEGLHFAKGGSYGYF